LRVLSFVTVFYGNGGMKFPENVDACFLPKRGNCSVEHERTRQRPSTCETRFETKKLIGLALELPPLQLGFSQRPDKRPKTCLSMNESDLSSEL